MLAVAVHDDREARLEPAVPRRIRVQAGQPLRFRISYRLADNPGGREEAKVVAEVRLGEDGPWHAEVAMRDRPIVDDSRAGDLDFELPALAAGTHVMDYRVRMETRDATRLEKDPQSTRTDLAGEVEIEAV